MFEDSQTAALRRAAKNVERLTMLRARKLNLTPNMLRVVMLLKSCPGLSAVDIQHALEFEKKTALYLVDELAKRKLVTRVVSTDNAKYRNVFLTSKGLEAADEGAAIYKRIEAAVAKLANGKFRSILDGIAGLDAGKAPEHQ